MPVSPCPAPHQALAALKLLRLSGVSASQALITTLVQLTGLQHLCLLLLPSTHCALPTDLSNNSSSSSSALALQELAPLTAIRGLTHLTVHGVQPAAASSPGDGGVVLHSKVGDTRRGGGGARPLPQPLSAAHSVHVLVVDTVGSMLCAPSGPVCQSRNRLRQAACWQRGVWGVGAMCVLCISGQAQGHTGHCEST